MAVTFPRLAFLAALLAVLAVAASTSDVVELDQWNFDKLVLKSDLPFAVEFYAPWCGHCKRLQPEWEKVAANLKDILPVGRVDCTAHATLCSRYGVQGYPTIKAFYDKGKTLDYNMQREAPAIVRWAMGALRAVIFDVKNDENLQHFFDAHPELPHVLLFSTKDKPTPLFKAMAQRFQQGIIFGLVPSSAASLCESFGVSEFPSLLLVTPTEHKVLPFSTEAASLKALFEEIAQSPNSPPPQSSSKAPTQAETTWTPIESKEGLDEKCRKFRCVVLIGSNEALKASILGSFAADGKLAFIDSAVDSEVRKLFGDGVDPMLVVYDGKRGRYAKAEELSEQAVHTLLERVLSGDVTYTPL